MSNDLQSKEGRDEFFREVFWRTWRGRTKGLLGGAVTGTLLGAGIGATVGLGVGLLAPAIGVTIGVGAAVLGGAAVMGSLGMFKGMEAFSDVGMVSSAIMAGFAQKEKMDLEKSGELPKQEEVSSSRPYNFKMGAIAATVGAVMGGVIAAGAALAIKAGAIPIGMGVFGLTGGAAAVACIATVALLGSTLGFNLSYFKNLQNASERVVEGNLSASLKELQGKGVTVDVPPQGMAQTKPEDLQLELATPENMARAQFRKRLMDEALLTQQQQGRGV